MQSSDSVQMSQNTHTKKQTKTDTNKKQSTKSMFANFCNVKSNNQHPNPQHKIKLHLKKK